MSTSEAMSPGTIVTIMVGALAIPAFFAWMMWRMVRTVERAERDPGYLRRRFTRFGLIYVGVAVFGIALVVTGKEPKETLIGLPVVALLAWSFFRAAIRANIPPT